MRWTSWKMIVKAVVVAAALVQAVAIQPSFANSGSCGGGYGCPGR